MYMWDKTNLNSDSTDQFPSLKEALILLIEAVLVCLGGKQHRLSSVALHYREMIIEQPILMDLSFFGPADTYITNDYPLIKPISFPLGPPK